VGVQELLTGSGEKKKKKKLPHTGIENGMISHYNEENITQDYKNN